MPSKKLLLSKYNPDLLKEWHPTKNGCKTPFEVSKGSKYNAWWKCKNGHEWQQIVYNRVKAKNCPYCSGIRSSVENNLSKNSPLISQEWHPFKNGNLKSENFLTHSNKKIWWKCRYGHEYESKISDRSKGSGCPYCSGKKLIPERSLARVNPELLKEWHPSKNAEITPYDMSAGSHKKVWWKCPKGEDHEWEATVKNRVNGRGCPVCSGSKVVLSNCIATKEPEIVKEWHPTKNGEKTPYNFTFGSKYNAWWLCNNGHEWQQSVSSRIRIRRCPYCTDSRITNENNLNARFPNIAKEWHQSRNGTLRPVDCFPNSNKKVWWHCLYGHEYKTAIAHRVVGTGCPYCSGKRASYKRNLETANPELCKEWHTVKNDGKNPTDYTPYSSKIVWWQCKRGHEWRSSISNRAKGRRCPVCNSSTSIIELRIYSELKKLFIEVEHRIKVGGYEIDIYLPSVSLGIEVDSYFYHKDKYDFELLKNNKLNQNGIELIRIREKGLRKIGEKDIFIKKGEISLSIIQSLIRLLINTIKNSSVLTILNEYLNVQDYIAEKEFQSLYYQLPSPFFEKSLEFKNTILSKDWDFNKNGELTPMDVSAGSKLKVWWKCINGHNWKATINSRDRGNGCPYCSGQKFTTDSSFGARYPLIANEWHPTMNVSLTPLMVSTGTKLKVWWICPKGHEWQASVGDRVRGHNCPYCSNKKVCEENCLAFVNPILAAEWHSSKNENLTPNDVVPGSHKKVWWCCIKGHEWIASIYKRSNGTGCPSCRRQKLVIKKLNKENNNQ